MNKQQQESEHQVEQYENVIKYFECVKTEIKKKIT